MSRRIWTTLDGWDVSAGWDNRPTGHFFLDIGRECEHDDDEDREGEECELCQGSGTQYRYNNLDDKTDNVGPMGEIHSLVYVEDKIRELLTDWPDEIITDLYEDRRLQVQNFQHDYGVVGKLREEVEG